jgi:hypothetical protein
VCAKIKCPQASRAPLNQIVDFDKPFDKLGVDILELTRSSSGNKYVVVFTDYLTKWIEAFPLRNMTAEAVATVFINEIICRHSVPRELLSDQGTQFTSNLVQSISNYFKINKIFTAPYNPQCNGLTERNNKTLCHMLAAYSYSNQSNWNLYLPLVLFAYRISQHATTQESPFAALYGREPRLLCDYDNYNNQKPNEFVKNLNYRWREAKSLIVEQAIKSKKQYDGKNVKPPCVYKVGDFVRLRSKTIHQGLKSKIRNDKFGDPMEIVEVLSPQNIRIKWKGSTKVINVDNCKPKEPDRINDQPRQSLRSREVVTSKPLSVSKTGYTTRYGRVVIQRNVSNGSNSF